MAGREHNLKCFESPACRRASAVRLAAGMQPLGSGVLQLGWHRKSGGAEATQRRDPQRAGAGERSAPAPASLRSISRRASATRLTAPGDSDWPRTRTGNATRSIRESPVSRRASATRLAAGRGHSEARPVSCPAPEIAVRAGAGKAMVSLKTSWHQGPRLQGSAAARQQATSGTRVSGRQLRSPPGRQ